MPSSPHGRPDRGLSRRQRITRTTHFQEAFQQGRKWVSRTMVMYLREGEGAALRLGVVSSKKVGNAVRRNRARRVLREAWRLNRHQFHGEVDVVLVARAAAPRVPFVIVQEDLLHLARKAGLRSG